MQEETGEKDEITNKVLLKNENLLNGYKVSLIQLIICACTLFCKGISLKRFIKEYERYCSFLNDDSFVVSFYNIWIKTTKKAEKDEIIDKLLLKNENLLNGYKVSLV